MSAVMKHFFVMLIRLFLPILLVFRVCSAELPKDKIFSVVLGPVPYYTETVTSGEGTLLVLALLKRLEKKGYQFKLSMLPWKRANVAFNTGEIDVLFPEIVADRTQKGMTGMPIFMSSQVIFTRKEDPVLNQLSDLSGKTVLFVRGIMKPPGFEGKHFEWLKVTDAQQAYKLLESRRADAYINWLEADNYNIPSLHYGNAVEKRYVAFRFQLTPIGAALMEAFNETLSEFIQSGDCRALVKQSVRPKELQMLFCPSR